MGLDDAAAGGGRTKFVDMPEEDFPIDLRLIDHDTGEQLYRVDVSGPAAVDIPGFAPRKVRAMITLATGMRYVSYPDGRTIHGMAW